MSRQIRGGNSPSRALKQKRQLANYSRERLEGERKATVLEIASDLDCVPSSGTGRDGYVTKDDLIEAILDVSTEEYSVT